MPAEGLNNFKMSGESRVTGLSTAEKISPRACQIMDLHIQGLKSKQIAERLELTPRYIGEIINAPNFQHTLAIRREKLQERLDDKIVNSTVDATNELKKHAIAAANKVVELMEGSDSESIQLKSSTEILDRAGVVSQKKGAEATATVVIVDDESAALINETLRMDMEKKDGE